MNERTRTYNSARNIMMGFISKFVNALLTFFGRQIFLQVLSLDYLGISGLFIDILRMLSLADLGLATAMAYSFYKPLAEKKEVELAALIHFYRKIYNIIAAAVLVIGLSLVPFLRKIVNLEHDIPLLEVYYLLALANAVISYLFVYKSSIITADQKGYLISQYSMWTGVLGLAVQIIILYTTKSYMAYCSVTIFTTLINNLIISRQANRYYPFIKQKAALNASDKQSIFQNMKSVVIYKIATVAISGTDSILISILVGTAFVGQYANYTVTVNNLYQIAYILFNSLTPSVGNLVARETAEKRLRVFHVMQIASFWISGFFVFCLYFLMDDFIILWLGEEFICSGLTKLAILLNFYLALTFHPIWAFREATGMYMKIKYIMLITAVLNILLSILLGTAMGTAGIIFATSISKICTFLWYEPKALFKDFFEHRVRNYFFAQIINFILLAVCIAVFHFMTPVHKSANWAEWLIKGGICAAIINTVYLLRYCRTTEFKEIIARFKSRVWVRNTPE